MALLAVKVTPRDLTFKPLMNGFEVYTPVRAGRVYLGWIRKSPDETRWLGEPPEGKTVWGRSREGVSRALIHKAASPKPKSEVVAAAPVVLAPPVAPAIPSGLTRECWMMAIAKEMEPWFEAIGYPVKNYYISMGDPVDSKLGWCWYRDRSPDNAAHIFINASLQHTMTIAEVICHELIHAALPDGELHSQRFKNIAAALDILGRKKSGRYTVATTAFKEKMAPIIERLGEFPGRRMLGRHETRRKRGKW